MLSSFWEGSTQVSTRTMSIRRLCAAGSLAAAVSFAAVVSCTVQPSLDFTCDELSLIHGADSIMRVLTIADPADSLVLRAESSDLSASALLSNDYAELERLMVETVTHPSQDGVGIAGPQVGLNRRVVAVQRFDKPGEPFEVYPNIRIVWASDSLAYGPEGCLSVPDRREDVLRSNEIVIEYADMELLRKSPGRKELGRKGLGWNQEKIPTVTDTISGFTAVIFQHETDHLDGILYIDRVQ